jgi:hypothetical protein
MGSRILSRSFQVEAQSAIDGTDSNQTPAHEDVEMVPDEPSSLASNHNPENNSEEMEDDEGDDDDDDDPGNVAMVPIADMLNARYGCENVRASLPLRAFGSDCPSRPNFSTRNTNFEWSPPDLFARANKS